MAARAAEATVGRTFGVAFEEGDDFITELTGLCAREGIRQGYIPVFLGAFHHAKVVGTCQTYDPRAPMLSEHVDLDAVEAIGAGTLAWDEANQTVTPHIHLSVGRRLHGAVGHTSHLFDAEVQFIIEMVIVEVASPEWSRPKDPALHDLSLLTFGQ